MTPYLLVVSKTRCDVFSALFFGGLPGSLGVHVRILEFGHDSLTDALAGAAAIIVMRHGLFSFGRLAASAGRARVPRYYFLDDNLMLLSLEPEVYGPYWSAYTNENVRRALAGFDGVLLASRPLLQYFEEQALHPNLIEYPPIAWPVLRRRDAGWGRDAGEPFRIAFFGGEHRRDLFRTLVYPAAQRLAAEVPVELVVAGIEAEALQVPGAKVPVVHLPYDVRYGPALEALACRRIDVLAHPAPPSRNNPYRNANVLINARAVGAVSVLSNVPPYDGFDSPPPALLCDNEPEAWYEALSRLAHDPQLCAHVFDRADAYCREHFSGRQNEHVIRTVLAAHAPPGSAVRAMRRIVTGPFLAFDRTLVRVMDAARSSPLLHGAFRRFWHGAV